jgi:hypothetical protein
MAACGPRLPLSVHPQQQMSVSSAGLGYRPLSGEDRMPGLADSGYEGAGHGIFVPGEDAEGRERAGH